MNLLLLLSALLSALTGAASTTRAPAAAHAARAAVVEAADAAVAANARLMRPVWTQPALVSMALPPIAAVAAPMPLMPLFASRRRE